MEITASELRKNIYNLLDQVIDTGVPLEIIRKGKKLKIVSENPKSKVENLKKRETFKGDPESFVHIDWSGEWNDQSGDDKYPR